MWVHIQLQFIGFQKSCVGQVYQAPFRQFTALDSHAIDLWMLQTVPGGAVPRAVQVIFKVVIIRSDGLGGGKRGLERETSYLT